MYRRSRSLPNEDSKQYEITKFSTIQSEVSSGPDLVINTI